MVDNTDGENWENTGGQTSVAFSDNLITYSDWLFHSILFHIFAGWLCHIYFQLVVWNIFHFSIYWEESCQLTNIFQRGWNHQPVIVWFSSLLKQVYNRPIDQYSCDGLKPPHFPTTVCFFACPQLFLWYTLQQTNIAMENHQFKQVNPLQTCHFL